MKRYDATTEMPRHVTVSEHAIGASAGLAAFAGLCCVLAGVQIDAAWKIIVAVGVIPVAIAGAGALIRVVEFAIPSVERRVGFDINGDGAVGENIRLIPVHHRDNVSMSGSDSSIDAEDLRYMIERLDMDKQTGWATREWIGETLPSGRMIANAEAAPYVEFIEVLERCGALCDRSERSKGTLRMAPEQILAVLRL